MELCMYNAPILAYMDYRWTYVDAVIVQFATCATHTRSSVKEEWHKYVTNTNRVVLAIPVLFIIHRIDTA